MAEPRPIGKVYNIPPQPPDAAHTRWIPAGALTIGVEYRDVTPEALEATYADNPEQLAEMLAKSPDGGFADEGVSLHVNGTADGHEYLRFDVFADEPHYHYVHNTGAAGETVNNVIDFDAVASGDMLAWALERLRTRLPEMLQEAGGDAVAAAVDPDMVARAVGEVERLAAAVRGS